MAKALPIVLVVALLGATAAAFAVTEQLKLVRSPIFDTRLEHKVISPVCDCPSGEETISFRLRESDRVTVEIVRGGDVVRTLADAEQAAPGGLDFTWDGRGPEGEVVPEGTYRPRVHLDRDRRTILMPNPIRVDVTPPPPPEIVEVAPPAFSPDGDGRNDKVSVRYRVAEQAHARLYVDGGQRVRSRTRPREGKLDWFGIVDGKPLPAGTYGLSLAAEDMAGNVSERTEPVEVAIRYVELGRSIVRVRALARFGVEVESDAETVRWRFAGGRGATEPGLLVLRAPRRPGEYRLFVEANGRAARARVTVVPRDR